MQTFASPKFNLTASGYFHNLVYAQLQARFQELLSNKMETDTQTESYVKHV
jgi:hypothetical protein